MSTHVRRKRQDNSMTPTEEDAIARARQAHEGQIDKAGAPYISHPLRVMNALQGEDARIAGVLHDVIEDSKIDEKELARLSYSPRIIEAVLAVTKKSGEDYDEFIARAALNPIARQVKIADLEDNMDLTRIANPTSKDEERLEKYRRALEFLKSGGA